MSQGRSQPGSTPLRRGGMLRRGDRSLALAHPCAGCRCCCCCAPGVPAAPPGEPAASGGCGVGCDGAPVTAARQSHPRLLAGDPPAHPHTRLSYLCPSLGGPARGCCCSCWWTRHGGGSPGATWGCRDPAAPLAPPRLWAGRAQCSHRRAPDRGLLGSTPDGCRRRGGLSCKAPGGRPSWWEGERGGGCPARGYWPPAARKGLGAHWAAAVSGGGFPPLCCPLNAREGPCPPGCQLSPAAGGK